MGKNTLVARTAEGRVVCDSTICTGCRTCEVICSLFHEGLVNPELSRIQIRTWEYEGWRSEGYTCRQCKNAECLAACPIGALCLDELTGAKIVDKEKCNGCRLCMEACPYTPPRIRYNREKNVCVKCNLCGGEPQCIRYCQEGALAFEED